MYEQLLETCEKQQTMIRRLRAELEVLREEGKGKGKDGKGKDKEERYFMREEEKFAEMVRKGKDKGKGKDGDDRCEHCGSLLRIPWTPASQGEDKGSSSSAARSRSPRPAWWAAAFPPLPQTPPE